jgi:hypothetical protein
MPTGLRITAAPGGLTAGTAMAFTEPMLAPDAAKPPS